ncbi:MAG: alanine--tRNA ligase [Ignavibacteria bacterium]|nr:alanine--tRNA ligase [Ignavibacteria bacterium]
MTSNEIRNQFFEFFENKDHRIVASAPVVPYDDPTLLFTNAGMNQFKDVFLGNGIREYKRAADTQKCIRVSGKHNDLEEVGFDTYHHTFFEMLGNWSFGDYYKKEAIQWAWELLTEIWKLPKERLYATVYKTDDEAFNCWETLTDINPKHILRFGEKDNFWEMGETGPCGPCSEIHINLSDNIDDASLVNKGVPECIEIWNLVFIQYNRKSDGELEPLKEKHVDTGMGFERLVAVLQGKNSNYDTDIFTPIIKKIEEFSGKNYEGEQNQIAMRVIADHIRTLTFAIADGAVPSNEGRGYVLRRILRRASRFARKLDLHEPILHKLVPTLAQTMGEIFPEIKSHQKQLEEIIKGEEESFGETLDRGLEIFDSIVKKLKKEKKTEIHSEDVFKLYDTYGFPFDLTELMAREINLFVDKNKFEILMNQQRERSREAGKFSTAPAFLKFSSGDKSIESSEFIGYDSFESKSSVLAAAEEFVVLDRTPFYAEAGGQIGDTGRLILNNEIINVTDTQRDGEVIYHKIDTPKKNLEGNIVDAKVDVIRRKSIMRNHSATHLLHKTLREILGSHVKQAGSLVDPDKLRFDFTHFKKVSKEDLKAIGQLINHKIRESLQLQHHRDIPFEQAKKMGALMFFGDKYGDKVNVVQFGDFTMEFCGGTHIMNTSEIGLLKIISESSISSGIRRIEAVTGEGVERYINSQIDVIDEWSNKYEQLIDEMKSLEKEISRLKLVENFSKLDSFIVNKNEVDDLAIVTGLVAVNDIEQLKNLGDILREKIKRGVGVLASNFDEKATFVCVVTDDLIKEKKLSAGKIVGELAKLVGGGGGGRPHLATAGGKDISKIDSALSNVENIIRSFINGS